jgi:TrpR-related protein YerC/YecD
MVMTREKERAKLNKEAVAELSRALAKVKKDEDILEMIQDLMSSSEIRDLARRLKAARLLYEGKTYQEIEEMLGMSPITINKIHFKTRGSRILKELF